jgi:hypothetical protein
MAFDQTKLGNLAAQVMDQLEQDYGAEAEIGDACLIVEVLSSRGSEVTVRTTNPRRHVTLGLLDFAQRIVREG